MLLSVFLLAALPGCSPALHYRPNPTEIDAREYDLMFTAAQDVLRDYGFEVDRRDYRFGAVTGRPLVAPTVLEPWRITNTTAHQTLAATTNPQRRLVTVSLERPESALETSTVDAPESATAPAEADARAGDPESSAARQPEPSASTLPSPATRPTETGYLLRVEVMVEQLEEPGRRLSGSTSGARIYDTLSQVPEELRERGITGAYWQPLGRDPYLEQRLLAAIIRRSFKDGR